MQNYHRLPESQDNVHAFEFRAPNNVESEFLRAFSHSSTCHVTTYLHFREGGGGSTCLHLRCPDGDWRFPCVLRMLNASEDKLRVWQRRMRGEAGPSGAEEETRRVTAEDARLASQVATVGRPSPEERGRVLRVRRGLGDVWAAACIK